MTIHPIKWISMSILIYGFPLLVLILTSCYHAIWRVVRPSQSIMWNYPPWPTKGTSPPSHYKTSFICFLILLVNIVFIFHKQKWTTSIINIYLFIYIYLFSFEQKKIIIPTCLVKTNSFYRIFQQNNYWIRNFGFASTIWLPNVKPT
jgi:hypothetical protein